MSPVKLPPSSREATVSDPVLPLARLKSKPRQAPERVLATFVNMLQAGVLGDLTSNSRAPEGLVTETLMNTAHRSRWFPLRGAVEADMPVPLYWSPPPSKHPPQGKG